MLSMSYNFLQALVSEDLTSRWIRSILKAQAGARKLPGSSALVVGVAAGLGCMAGVPGLLPGIARERLSTACHDPTVSHAILKVLFLYVQQSMNVAICICTCILELH